MYGVGNTVDEQFFIVCKTLNQPFATWLEILKGTFMYFKKLFQVSLVHFFKKNLLLSYFSVYLIL